MTEISNYKKIQHMKKEAKRLLSFFQKQPDFKVNNLGTAQDVISICQGYPNWHSAQTNLMSATKEKTINLTGEHVIFSSKDDIPYFEHNNTFSTFYLLNINIKNSITIKHSIEATISAVKYFSDLTSSQFNLYIGLKKNEGTSYIIPHNSLMKVSHETYLNNLESSPNTLSVILELKSSTWDIHRLFSKIEPIDSYSAVDYLEKHILESFISSEKLEIIDTKNDKLTELFSIDKNFNYLKLLSNLSNYISFMDNPNDSFEIIFKNSFKDLLLIKNKKILDLALSLNLKSSTYNDYPEVDFENLIVDYTKPDSKNVVNLPLYNSANKMPLSGNFKERNLILGLPGCGKSLLIEHIIYSYLEANKDNKFQLFYVSAGNKNLANVYGEIFNNDFHIIKNYHNLILDNNFQFNIFKPSYIGLKISDGQIFLITKILLNLVNYFNNTKSPKYADEHPLYQLLQNFYKNNVEFNIHTFSEYCLKNHPHFKEFIAELHDLPKSHFNLLFINNEVTDKKLLKSLNYKLIEIFVKIDLFSPIYSNHTLLNQLVAFQISNHHESHYIYDEAHRWFYEIIEPSLKLNNDYYTCTEQIYEKSISSSTNITNVFQNLHEYGMSQSHFEPEMNYKIQKPKYEQIKYWIRYKKTKESFKADLFKLMKII